MDWMNSPFKQQILSKLRITQIFQCWSSSVAMYTYTGMACTTSEGYIALIMNKLMGVSRDQLCM